jgi:Tol biopolymer transport system component
MTAATLRQGSLVLINELQTPAQGENGPGTTGAIYTMRADGTSKTLLTSNGGAPSWTPDGRIIFVSNRSGSQQIWTMDADGRNALQFGNFPPTTLPVMPQQGKNGLVVFMGNDATTEVDGNTGIWVMQKDGSGLNDLVQGMQPSLAPSGSWIAYTLQTDAPYHREIWRINTDGTGLKQLTFLGDDPDYPDANAAMISPDERMVAFFSGKESDRALPGAQPQQSIYTWGYRNVAVVPATGGVRKTLTPCKPVTTPLLCCLLAGKTDITARTAAMAWELSWQSSALE